MTLSPVSDVNLPALLAPIPSLLPCGESLRYSETYDQIREARREEYDNLPQGVWKTDIKKADWDQVNQLCQDALKTRTKDLHIAAWLTEAWIHLSGMEGLVYGLDLMLKLTQTYWQDIHPQIKDGVYELRLVPYDWMNSQLSEACQYIPISVALDRGTPPKRLMDFYEAQRLEFLSNKSVSTQPTESPPSSLGKISPAVEQTPTAFYSQMKENARTVLETITALEKELRLHLSEQAPTFYRLREKIEAAQRVATHILANRGEKKETEIATATPDKIHVQSTKKFPISVIENREQAYQILEDVAVFLERIEPHSPTPYLIRRAITWGTMSLSEVFADTLTHSKDLSLLLDVLNVEKVQS